MNPQPPDNPPARRTLGADELRRAREIVSLAWYDLPPEHRALLEAIGAAGRDVVDRPLGGYLDDLVRSAGSAGLAANEIRRLNDALGVWSAELRVVLIDAGHPDYEGLGPASYEEFLVRVAWHEWAHALSISRASDEEIEAGPKLLELAPDGVVQIIRGAGYRKHDYTHELIAEIYVLLMARRRRGETGRPPWLASEIYEMVKRVTGWTE